MLSQRSGGPKKFAEPPVKGASQERLLENTRPVMELEKYQVRPFGAALALQRLVAVGLRAVTWLSRDMQS